MQNSMQNLSKDWFLTLLAEPDDNETRLDNVRALLRDFSAEDVIDETFVALQESYSKLHTQADTCLHNPVQVFANLLYSFGLMCSISIDRTSVRRILPQLSVMIKEMMCRVDTDDNISIEELQHAQWCCLATCCRLLHSFVSESSELQKSAVHFALQVISSDEVDEHRRPLLLKAVEFISQLLSSSPIFVGGERGPFLLRQMMLLLSKESMQRSSELFVELCEAVGKFCKLLLPPTRPNAVVMPLLKPEQCDADLRLAAASATDSGYESGDEDEFEGDEDEEVFWGTLAPSFFRELQRSVDASEVCISVFRAYEHLNAVEHKISVASALSFLARVLVRSTDKDSSVLDDCIEFSLDQVQSCSTELRQHQSVRVLALAFLQSTAEMLRESGASAARWMQYLVRLVLQMRANGCFFERIRDKFIACFSALLLHGPDDQPEALVATMFLDEVLPVLKDPLIISDSVFALRKHSKILEERLPQLVAYLNIGLTRHSNYSVRVLRSICCSLGRIVCYSGAAFVPFLADTTSGVLESLEGDLYRAGMDALVACARLLWSAHKHADLLQKDDDAAMSLATSRFFSLLIQISANDVNDSRDDSVDVDLQLQNCALEMTAFLIEERILTPEVENWAAFQELLEHLVSEVAQPVVFEDDIDVRSSVTYLLCSVGRVAQHDSRFHKCMNWPAALEVMERASESGFSYVDECVQVLRQRIQASASEL